MSKSKLSQGLKRAQSRLLNQNSKNILNSVMLLYVVLFASITDLLYLVSTGAHSNVIVFILVAYVTSMFSKNMTVILITSLAITNIYHLGRSVVVKEGLGEGEEGEDEKTDEDEKSEDSESKDENSESKDKKSESKDKKSESKESKSKKGEKLPEEYKKTLAQLSDPETLKTIEGLKSLEPLLGKMERVIGMFN